MFKIVTDLISRHALPAKLSENIFLVKIKGYTVTRRWMDAGIVGKAHCS